MTASIKSTELSRRYLTAGLLRQAWRDAMVLAAATMAGANVAVDVIDIGRGFPAAYPGSEPPPLGAFVAQIQAGLDALNLPVPPRLWSRTRPSLGVLGTCTSGLRQVGG